MRHIAETPVTQIGDYGVLVIINVWYDASGRVNVSKTMQNNSVELSTAVSPMDSVMITYLIIVQMKKKHLSQQKN